MTNDPNNKFADDVCHCIECAVKTDPTEDAPPFFFYPTEEEELEMEANFLDDAGVREFSSEQIVLSESLNLTTLREANVRRCEEIFHKLHDWSPTDWATAMAGECGEACNEIKKLRRLDGADADADTAENRHWLKVNIAHELADLVIYADLLAARLEIDLGEAIKFKFNEVSDKRKSTVKL